MKGRVTRRAIGWYETDASRDEKIKALKQVLIDAALELGELGVPLPEIEDATTVAYDTVEWHA